MSDTRDIRPGETLTMMVDEFAEAVHEYPLVAMMPYFNVRVVVALAREALRYRMLGEVRDDR